MKIKILTLNGHFAQSVYPWQSLDVEKISSYLEKRNLEVEVLDIQEIANTDLEIENETIFFTSSQVPEKKLFIDDVITILSKKNNLIPSYELFRCHDNKGFQELIKKKQKIPTIPAYYYSSRQSCDFEKWDYPKVIKKVGGASGTGVWLIRSAKDFKKTSNRFSHRSFFTEDWILKMKAVINAKIRKKSEWSVTKKWFDYLRSQKEERVLIQEFIPNLEFDFKVLVFYDRYYIIKRYNRPKDFRASGSGKFEWPVQPESEVLNFAKDVFTKLDAPFSSLDICIKDGHPHLIEFQVPHMGPITLIDSTGYFQKNRNDGWEFNKTKSILEETYGYSLFKFITSKNE